MVSRLNIDSFLQLSEGHPVIDVRAPAEYDHAHLPGAHSLPLFSDEERALIGTCYKHQGREQAMMEGLQFFGNNMQRIISGIKHLTDDRQLFIHCWRGGMRSSVVAWMLDLFGYRVATLNGGYKSFRHLVLNSFAGRSNIVILGGKTGSAKTTVLHALRSHGEQVVDLEALAHHKGSAFGGINETKAPSQEQFENDLWQAFRKTDPQKTIWLEDESQRIGNINIPNSLWQQMRSAPLVYLEIPFDRRLHYLVHTYGAYPAEALMQATMRIQKRLGGQHTKQTLGFLNEGNLSAAFAILLAYYDKAYLKATAQRDAAGIVKISSDTVDAAFNARLVSAIKVSDPIKMMKE